MKLKAVHVPRGYAGLHCEVNGCIINIRVDLTDNDGRAVTSIHILPDQYTSEPVWKVILPLDTPPHEAEPYDCVTLRVRQEAPVTNPRPDPEEWSAAQCKTWLDDHGYVTSDDVSEDSFGDPLRALRTRVREAT